MFCGACKVKVDNTYTTAKASNDLDTFKRLYAGQVSEFRAYVDKTIAETVRADGQQGRGYRRVKWDSTRYSESQSTFADSRRGLRQEHLTETEFISWWKGKVGCSDEVARDAWQKRVKDPSYEKAVDPECGAMTVAVYAKRYADASTGEHSANTLATGLKDFKKVKPEKEEALKSNLKNRLQTKHLGDVFTGQHAEYLGIFDKGVDLQQDPDKPDPKPDKKIGAGHDAETQEAFELELKIGHLKANTRKAVDGLCSVAVAAVVDACAAIHSAEKLCKENAEDHPPEIYAAPKDIVAKRLMALWIALGQAPDGLEDAYLNGELKTKKRLPKMPTENDIEECERVMAAFVEELHAAGSGHIFSTVPLGMKVYYLAWCLVSGATSPVVLSFGWRLISNEACFIIKTTRKHSVRCPEEHVCGK